MSEVHSASFRSGICAHQKPKPHLYLWQGRWWVSGNGHGAWNRRGITLNDREAGTFTDACTKAYLTYLGDILSDPERALRNLPEAERQRYRDAQQSVIDARDYAQRHAHQWWVGSAS